MQQYEAQLKEGNPTPTPRSQVIIDLTNLIQEYKNKGEEIILCLDTNEEMEKGGICKKGSISQLTKDNVMICAHEYLGDTGGTSKTSGKIMDYIWVTSRIIPAIIKGGNHPFEEGITSYYRALYLDLDAEILFGKITVKLDIKQVRKLDTSYPKRTEKYVEDIVRNFEARGLFRALGELKKMAYTRKILTAWVEQKFNN